MTADEIRSLRERAGMTQRELALAMDVSTTSVSRWECGERCPSPHISAFMHEFKRVLIRLDDWPERRQTLISRLIRKGATEGARGVLHELMSPNYHQ